MFADKGWIALGLVLTVGAVGCETQDEAEIDVGEQDVSMSEEGMDIDAEEPWNDWDVDADGAINEEEFQEWWSNANPFEDWDVDGDAELSEEEWNATMDVEFGEVDLDGSGTVEQDEMRDGVYVAWDENDDGRIQEEEWHGVDI